MSSAEATKIRRFYYIESYIDAQAVDLMKKIKKVKEKMKKGVDRRGRFVYNTIRA